MRAGKFFGILPKRQKRRFPYYRVSHRRVPEELFPILRNTTRVIRTDKTRVQLLLMDFKPFEWRKRENRVFTVRFKRLSRTTVPACTRVTHLELGFEIVD